GVVVSARRSGGRGRSGPSRSGSPTGVRVRDSIGEALELPRPYQVGGTDGRAREIQGLQPAAVRVGLGREQGQHLARRPRDTGKAGSGSIGRKLSGTPQYARIQRRTGVPSDQPAGSTPDHHQHALDDDLDPGSSEKNGQVFGEDDNSLESDRTRSQNIRPCRISKGGTTTVGMKNAAPSMLASIGAPNSPW